MTIPGYQPFFAEARTTEDAIRHGYVCFSRSVARSGDRVLIESTCHKCGESKLVSWADGSLGDWEENHSERHNAATPIKRSKARWR